MPAIQNIQKTTKPPRQEVKEQRYRTLDQMSHAQVVWYFLGYRDTKFVLAGSLILSNIAWLVTTI
jgi:hypothetical protein